MQRTFVTAALFILIPTGGEAQSTARPDSSKPAPAVDFSGILFANYQYRAESTAGSANKFDVERAYLTFRAPAGDRASVRITADLYQQAAAGSDSYYRGWSLRAKYAYIQYDYLKGKAWRASARLGLLQTVFVEHDDSFWPRWLGTSPTERAGFFASADAGFANTIMLPGGLGEIYTTVTNGPGYTSREVDRFKDVATRVTIRPWASAGPASMRGVALTAWGYKGAIASGFVNGGAGQAGTVGDALRRDRWGVHAASASPRLTVAAQYGSRIDEGEDGLNTQASPREVVDSVGTLLSAYASVRPLPGAATQPHPLSLLLRIDRVTTNTDTDESYDFIVGGVIWDFSRRLSMSLDYQAAVPREGRPVQPARTWFAHFVARY